MEAWQQVIADAAVDRTLIAVAGTHGKSTTAGWLVHVLVEADRDPAAFVGALLGPELTGGAPATARTGRGAAFVVEADEYAGNFDAYRPDVAILTTAEWDHPDVFADADAVHAAFAAWLGRVPDGGAIVANVGDPGVAAVLDALHDHPARVVAVAITETDPRRGGHLRGLEERYATAAGPATPLLGRIVAADPDGTTLELHGLDPLAGPVSVRLATAGRHNAANALAVAAARTRAGPRRPTPSWAVWPRSEGSDVGWNARARPVASSCTTTTGTIPRRSAPRSRPSASVSPVGACGRCTSR